MKTIVKMILPVAVFVLASAGAVSTKSNKEDALKKVLTTEYIQISNSPTNCSPVQVNCSTFNNGNVCRDQSDSNDVFRKNGAGQCSIELYKTNP